MVCKTPALSVPVAQTKVGEGDAVVVVVSSALLTRGFNVVVVCTDRAKELEMTRNTSKEENIVCKNIMMINEVKY